MSSEVTGDFVVKTRPACEMEDIQCYAPSGVSGRMNWNCKTLQYLHLGSLLILCSGKCNLKHRLCIYLDSPGFMPEIKEYI